MHNCTHLPRATCWQEWAPRLWHRPALFLDLLLLPKHASNVPVLGTRVGRSFHVAYRQTFRVARKVVPIFTCQNPKKAVKLLIELRQAWFLWTNLAARAPANEAHHLRKLVNTLGSQLCLQPVSEVVEAPSTVRITTKSSTALIRRKKRLRRFVTKLMRTYART